jgi:hypothetical protein
MPLEVQNEQNDKRIQLREVPAWSLGITAGTLPSSGGINRQSAPKMEKNTLNMPRKQLQ